MCVCIMALQLTWENAADVIHRVENDTVKLQLQQQWQLLCFQMNSVSVKGDEHTDCAAPFSITDP